MTSSPLRQWYGDIAAALGLLTRLRVPRFGFEQADDAPAEGDAGMARAYWAFPLVGLLVGLVAGLVMLALLKCGLPSLGAAALTLGATALLTGALHEDGLSDTADGFGGGRDRASKLSIMKDSNIGAFGALALLVCFAAKASALAALSQSFVVPALIAAHVLARGVIPAVVAALPFAREDGLARSVGTPSFNTAVVSGVLMVAITLFCLPAGEAALALVVAALLAAAIGFLALRQIAGVSGDALGAIEQSIETAVLLVLAAFGR